MSSKRKCFLTIVAGLILLAVGVTLAARTTTELSPPFKLLDVKGGEQHYRFDGDYYAALDRIKGIYPEFERGHVGAGDSSGGSVIVFSDMEDYAVAVEGPISPTPSPVSDVYVRKYTLLDKILIRLGLKDRRFEGLY